VSKTYDYNNYVVNKTPKTDAGNSDVTRQIYIHIMEKLKERDKETLKQLKLISNS